METELSEFSRENKALELAMSHNKLRLAATTKEMVQEREQCHTLKVELRTIKAGLHNTSRFIQEPQHLKEVIKDLYKKHLQDFDQVRGKESYAMRLENCNQLEARECEHPD